MNWQPICPLDDILPHTGVGALVDGHQLAIFRLDKDAVYALDNYCPHSQAHVLARGLLGDIGGELVVASPVYKHHYRLRDGICLEDAARSVTAHAVRVTDGRVEVALSSPQQAAA